MKVITTKVNQAIGLLQKLKKNFAKTGINNYVQSFCDVDYGDMIYDEAYNKTFHQKLESIQYNVYLNLSGAIRESSTEKLYRELGLEFLQY